MSEKKKTDQVSDDKQVGITKRLIVSDKRVREVLKKLDFDDEFSVSRSLDLLKKEKGISVNIIIISERNKKLVQDIRKFKDDNDRNSLISVFHAGDPANEEIYAIIDNVIPFPLNPLFLARSIKNGFRELQHKFEVDFFKQQVHSKDSQLLELSHIGQQLMMEKDHATLLQLILLKCREMTNADAGSLYLVEKEGEDQQLRFMLTQNDSVSFEFQEFTMPISRSSISGFVAATGQMLNLPDVYYLPPESEFSINKSFDEKIGYRTKSMLVIPLIDHMDEIIGVIQLINRKKSKDLILRNPEDFEDNVGPFPESGVDMVRALAGHAAISIENAELYRSIERLFEGFVNAAVTAIESRDPTTHGHSGRVADLTVNLAQKIDGLNNGPFKKLTFSRDQIKEIRYASLLHDFGKVGVRENVLLKAKKLYPEQLNEIRMRIQLLRNAAEIAYLRDKHEYLRRYGEGGYKYRAFELEAEFRREMARINDMEQSIVDVNEPTVLKGEKAQELDRIARVVFTGFSGKDELLINENELNALSIGRGSLTTEERLEIESHVTHTYNFLKKVPWTSDLMNIPEIAYSHHEKLNGDGYPKSLKSCQIPVQSKMMTISDIFDALTASDRPYKKAVPYERALQILQFEVNDNHVDKDLFDVFVEAEVYKCVL